MEVLRLLTAVDYASAQAQLDVPVHTRPAQYQGDVHADAFDAARIAEALGAGYDNFQATAQLRRAWSRQTRSSGAAIVFDRVNPRSSR